MSLYSYHIFLFPFQWEKKGSENLSFSDRFVLNKILPMPSSNWENIPFPKTKNYEIELYNEKNFFYKFVHNTMYDSGKREFPAIRHFERKEAYESRLEFHIAVKKDKESFYELKLKSVGLDLFSTGTGVLIFYIENEKYSDIFDIKRINQFGRRVFPPFLGKQKGIEDTKEAELADYIKITGLIGDPARYSENFNTYTPADSWQPARFIHSLIEDLDPQLIIEPVVDDRMFTMCWTFSNDLGNKISADKSFEEFVKGNLWHEYLFVDSGGSTCQNDSMQSRILKKHTYERWQKEGTLFGATRYSLMAISKDNSFARDIVFPYFRTIYTRIVELVMLQRSSVLKFSAEVTTLSTLPDKDTQQLADRIDKFYKAYIRFVNQVYFREITAQEQGIEIYEMLQANLNMKEQVEDLDAEISELHNYASMLDEKAQTKNLSLLTILGSLFLVPSFIVGFFGMNLFNDGMRCAKEYLIFLIIVMVLLSGGLFLLVQMSKKGRKKSVYIIFGLLIIIVLALIFSSLSYGKFV